MSLRTVRDEFLVRRVTQGDDAAFVELVRRYEPLLGAATRCPAPEGMDGDDLRQAALIGLLEACRASDGHRRFSGIAARRVRWKVGATRRNAAAGKHRVLTDAARCDEEQHDLLATRAAADEAADPAHVFQLREHVREALRVHEEAARMRAEIARRRASAPGGDLRRRYSDEQRSRAVELVASGSSVAAAAAAVGASYVAVREWAHAAGDGKLSALGIRRTRISDREVARRYSDEQIAQVRRLVTNGHAVREAAATIGASHTTVVRWLREAA